MEYTIETWETSLEVEKYFCEGEETSVKQLFNGSEEEMKDFVIELFKTMEMVRVYEGDNSQYLIHMDEEGCEFNNFVVNSNLEFSNDYVIKIWETEEDREYGFAEYENFFGTSDEVIEYAKKQYRNVACVEAYESDKESSYPFIHLSDDGCEINGSPMDI